MRRNYDAPVAFIIGWFLLIIIINIAWIGTLIWAIISLVQHFT